jgi:uncharacterized membrane protein SpoIIM required for sporulation
VDLDAFVAVHAAQWDRLDRLSRRRRLSGEEADELVLLYQRAATHLSVVRSAFPDAALAGRLSTSVATARGAVSGGHEPFWRELARLFAVSFPTAVYRARWWAIGAALGSTLVAVALGVWVAGDPRAQAAVATPAQIRRLVNTDFEKYYSEHAATSFAAQVWTNNAWVAAMCFIFGITGVGVVFALLSNAFNVGVIGGLMAANGKLGLFFGLILPHGLLELTAVFVAAASGLKVFWAWVDPGPLPRADALAREGRAMVTVAMGLVVVLFVSGLIEAFVTPSPLPTWARIGIGAIALLAFLGYVAVLGGRAVRSGEHGDLDSGLVGDAAPVVG